MQKKLLKICSLFLSLTAAFSSIIPIFAYDLDENNNSAEKIEYQTTKDDDFSFASDVFAKIGSIYKVTIPKTVVLSGSSKSANYIIKAEGDIAGYEFLNIVPDESFKLYSKNKDAQDAFINQDKTSWRFDEFDTNANGIIEALSITAGKWSGAFNFNIFISEDEDKVLGDIILPYDLGGDYKLVITSLKKAKPGIYDKKGNLIKSYDYLVLNENIDNKTVYNINKPNSLGSVLTKYPETEYVVLPDTIKTIETGSLNNLEYVNMPTSVSKIEDNAFTNINYVDIPDTVGYVGSQNTKTYKNGLPIKEIVVDLKNNDSADIVLEKGYTYKIEALYNFTDDVTGKSTITSTDESVVSYRPVYYIDALEVGNCVLSGTYNLNGFKKRSFYKN